MNTMKLQSNNTTANQSEELPLHLDVYFQPILDTRTAAIKGTEALLRVHTDEGDLETYGFIENLKAVDELYTLDRWVIEQSLISYSQWQYRYRKDLLLYINISGETLKDPDFPEFVSKSLAKYEFYPDYMVLEIDIEDCIDPLAQECLINLRKTGVSIAVDNIGKDAQNASYLSEGIFDIFKLDRNLFYQPQHQSEIRNQLLRLNASNTQVVAVGIEEKEQITLCERTGIKLFQGYFAAQPLPADDFESWFLKNSV